MLSDELAASLPTLFPFVVRCGVCGRTMERPPRAGAGAGSSAGAVDPHSGALVEASPSGSSSVAAAATATLLSRLYGNGNVRLSPASPNPVGTAPYGTHGSTAVASYLEPSMVPALKPRKAQAQVRVWLVGMAAGPACVRLPHMTACRPGGCENPAARVHRPPPHINPPKHSSATGPAPGTAVCHVPPVCFIALVAGRNAPHMRGRDGGKGMEVLGNCTLHKVGPNAHQLLPSCV